MKNIFTILATVIVTRFIMKTVDRIKNPPMPTKEELHEELLRKKREADRMHNARLRPVNEPVADWERDMMQAEAQRWDGPKVAAEGCAIGSCNGR